jgi:hypothetical protein
MTTAMRDGIGAHATSIAPDLKGQSITQAVHPPIGNGHLYLNHDESDSCHTTP